MTLASVLAALAQPLEGRPPSADNRPELGTDPPGAAAAQPRSGRELFLETCASCHGTDGRGARDVGFDIPLPDFTDCSFASREPRVDWLSIAHRGGPARAFDETMPSFEAARSDEELESIVAHLKSFCEQKRWPQGELNLPRAQVTSKAYPEDEVVLAGVTALEGPTDVSAKFIYGKRFGARYQFEASLPVGFREVGSDEAGLGNWAEGVGDIGMGLKRVVFHSSRSGTIFTLATEVFMPTGDTTDGYGRGTWMVEPFLSAGQVIGGSGFVQLQGGFELPMETDQAEREAIWRFALGRTYRPKPWGRTWSPMIEFAGARALEADARTSWDAIPQMCTSLSRRQHVQANLGVRLPMTDLDERPTELMLFVLWDWFDGSLFGGW